MLNSSDSIEPPHPQLDSHFDPGSPNPTTHKVMQLRESRRG